MRSLNQLIPVSMKYIKITSNSLTVHNISQSVDKSMAKTDSRIVLINLD